MANQMAHFRVMSSLILKRTSASRPSGEWNDDDVDMLAEGVAVGRIMKASASPEGIPWMWTLALGQHKDRWPTHGYEATREAAMAAFAKSWRREEVCALCGCVSPGAERNRLCRGPERGYKLSLVGWKPRRESDVLGTRAPAPSCSNRTGLNATAKMRALPLLQRRCRRRGRGRGMRIGELQRLERVNEAGAEIVVALAGPEPL